MKGVGAFCDWIRFCRLLALVVAVGCVFGSSGSFLLCGLVVFLATCFSTFWIFALVVSVILSAIFSVLSSSVLLPFSWSSDVTLNYKNSENRFKFNHPMSVIRW